MSRRKRRVFTQEFKADTVRLVSAGAKTLPQVAKDLDLTESSVRNWVKDAQVATGRGLPGALVREERDELVQLRRENRQLKMEREILKKAAAFFARESA